MVFTVTGIVMLGLEKLVYDRNPWVRKTVALGLIKVYE
jgi:AP-3 complex subunit beta